MHREYEILAVADASLNGLGLPENFVDGFGAAVDVGFLVDVAEVGADGFDHEASYLNGHGRPAMMEVGDRFEQLRRGCLFQEIPEAGLAI